MRYLRPETLGEALAALATAPHAILAGGTDFYPAAGDRPLRTDVLDITGLAALRGVARAGDGWRLGALTTWTDVVKAGLPPRFDALKGAAREVGSVQIQNVATVAGNLCNASPAADGVPPLLALNAQVELSRQDGTRVLPLGDFLQGNRRTALAADEMMTAILIPDDLPGGDERSHFVKLGARTYLVISIAMVAAVVAVDDAGAIAQARVSVGSCSVVARRLTALEADLTGQPLAQAAAIAAPRHMADLSPIDDVRATAAYRREAALELVRRALSHCAGGQP
ncbi:MAG: FAD binding domain-containing protein [Rhodobacterales bacterium]|nr:FAD binding domain-containing protein [Rhodobacterales bacterium]